MTISFSSWRPSNLGAPRERSSASVYAVCRRRSLPSHGSGRWLSCTKLNATIVVDLSSVGGAFDGWWPSVVLGGEDEGFDGEVGVEVVGAEEGDHLASGDLLDSGGEVCAHGLLVGPAGLEDEVLLAVADQRSE